jgi:hypothetical protein
MKKNIGYLSLVALCLASTMVWAAGGGRGGAGGGRGGGGGRGNTGDAAPSNSPSAKTLTKVTTPTSQPDANGFIKRWLILDPIYGVAGGGQNAAHANALKEYFPGQMTVIPKDGDKVTAGGTELTWRALDTSKHNVNLVHFANDLGISSANDAVFWVVTVINCPEEMKDVRLGIGSNDASVWWVNGQELCGIYGDILSYPDDAVSKRITLKKGANVVRAFVHNARGQTDFCARFLDDQGNAVTNFTVDLNAK